MNNFSVNVTDPVSNYNDQLVTIASMIGRSAHRQAIFECIYEGKKQIKTIAEIAQKTKLTPKHVLTEGRKLSGYAFEKVPLGYKKKREFATCYRKILSLAKDKKKRDNLPTKISHKVGTNQLILTVKFPVGAKNAHLITIDDIDTFDKSHSVSTEDTSNFREEQIKEGFKKIVGEDGSFRDWGGEKSDLYTTRLLFKRKRISTAIAFKGRGTSGKLVPAKMGKNGDQIGRLFTEPAVLFLVVYNGQIDSSIISQMQAYAIGQAIGGKDVYFGVIDGNDLGRIASAYPSAFSK